MAAPARAVNDIDYVMCMLNESIQFIPPILKPCVPAHVVDM
jgi:hypothetical protein